MQIDLRPIHTSPKNKVTDSICHHSYILGCITRFNTFRSRSYDWHLLNPQLAARPDHRSFFFLPARLILPWRKPLSHACLGLSTPGNLMSSRPIHLILAFRPSTPDYSGVTTIMWGAVRSTALAGYYQTDSSAAVACMRIHVGGLNFPHSSLNGAFQFQWPVLGQVTQ